MFPRRARVLSPLPREVSMLATSEVRVRARRHAAPAVEPRMASQARRCRVPGIDCSTTPRGLACRVRIMKRLATVYMECERCGLPFEPIKGGLCHRCDRILCPADLHGDSSAAGAQRSPDARSASSAARLAPTDREVCLFTPRAIYSWCESCSAARASPAFVTTLAVIPARLGATRLPRKPLRLLGGSPLIVRVFERVAASALADRVVVATDSEEVARVARDAGARVRPHRLVAPVGNRSRRRGREQTGVRVVRRRRERPGR